MSTRFVDKPSAQRGATLLVGIVMLVMITLVAISVIRLTMRHTQVVNNEQLRTEAAAAANFALDFVLNTPLSEWTGYVGSAGKTEYINLGTTQLADTQDTSIAVKVSSLECKRGHVLLNKELADSNGVVTDEANQSCIFSSNGLLKFGNSSNDSLCIDVLWEMHAQADDKKLLAATRIVTQGVEVRADVSGYTDACK